MKCPLCDQKTTPQFAPFCSKGCKTMDLLRWLNGTYRIPTEEQEEIKNNPLDEEGLS